MKRVLFYIFMLLVSPSFAEGEPNSGGGDSQQPVSQTQQPPSEAQDFANDDKIDKDISTEVNGEWNAYSSELDRTVVEGDMTGASEATFTAADQEKFKYFDSVRSENAKEYSRSAQEANLRAAYLQSLVPIMQEGIGKMQEANEKSEEDYKRLANLQTDMNDRFQGVTIQTGAVETGESVKVDMSGIDNKGLDVEGNQAINNNIGDGIDTLSSSTSEYAGLLGSSDMNSNSAVAKKYRTKVLDVYQNEKLLASKGAIPKIPEQFKGSFAKAVKRASDIFDSTGGSALSKLFAASTPGVTKTNSLNDSLNSTPKRRTVKILGANRGLASVSVGNSSKGQKGKKKGRNGEEFEDLDDEDEYEDEDEDEDAENEVAGLDGDEDLFASENANLEMSEEARMAAEKEQINTSRHIPIWKIITRRYIKSGYPRLVKRRILLGID